MSESPPKSGPSVVPFDGAVDCHVHVYGPQQRYPFVEPRRYTPDDATFEEYREIAEPLGLQRVVLTQPSVHGLDNTAMLDAVASRPRDTRAVVMLPADVDETTLERLHAAGARAVRTQMKPHSSNPLSLDQLRGLADRIAPFGWHAEIHVDVSWLDDTDVRLADLSVPVVIEHMGHMKTTEGIDHPGFRALVRFVRDGGWVKLSGAYINSVEPEPYRDVTPYVEGLLAAAPDRLVWGSNWPHPHQEPLPSTRRVLGLLSAWVAGDDALLRRILVRNPSILYDFTS